jgi:hypothetical protein
MQLASGIDGIRRWRLRVAAPRELSTDYCVSSQRARSAPVAVLASLVAALLVAQLELAAAALAFGLLAAVAIAWRPCVGLYLALGLAVLFEPGGADPLMLPGTYLFRGLQSTLGLRGFVLSPIEMMLLFTLFVVLVRAVAGRGPALRGGRLVASVALFSLSLAAGLARGVLDGGDPYVALWEARALLLIPICYLLAANLVRDSADAQMLTGVLLLTSGLFAVEGAYRQVFLIGTGELNTPSDFAFAHESVIFLAGLALLPLALSFGRAPLWQRLCSMLFAPIALFTLLASQRRAGIAALVVALVAYGMVFVVARPRAAALTLVSVLIGCLIYFPLFWSDAGLLGQPARTVRSFVQPESYDALSNDYRAQEKINVRATILANPLLGVGFGREFTFVVPLADLSWWPFWRYEPHHNVLWVWLKTGLSGFVVFWVLMGRALGLAAYLGTRLDQSDERAMALIALAGVTCTLVFSYVDLGLTSSRVTLFLGALLGTLAVLGQLPFQQGTGRTLS